MPSNKVISADYVCDGPKLQQTLCVYGHLFLKVPSIPTVHYEYHDGLVLEGDVFGTNPKQLNLILFKYCSYTL